MIASQLRFIHLADVDIERVFAVSLPGIFVLLLAQEGGGLGGRMVLLLASLSCDM